MNDTDKEPQETPPGCKPSWIKTRLLPILMLIFIVGIVIGVFLAYKYNPGMIENLKGYGYLGAFIISIILNASVVLPVGNFVVIAALGATLPSATLVGLTGGIGAAIGEMTGYMAGYSGQALVATKTNRWYLRLESWLRKHGPLLFSCCRYSRSPSMWRGCMRSFALSGLEILRRLLAGKNRPL